MNLATVLQRSVLKRHIFSALLTGFVFVQSGNVVGQTDKTLYRLSEAQILSEITGKTFEGIYTRDGVSFSEIYKSNGELDYRDERETLSGQWVIKNGLFCNLYTKPVGGCFALYRTGPNCVISYSAPDETRPYTPPAGTIPGVRMWDSSKASTCPDAQPIG